VTDDTKAADARAKEDAKVTADTAKAKVASDKAENDRVLNDPIDVPDGLLKTAHGVALDEQRKQLADAADAAQRAQLPAGKTDVERRWDKAITTAKANVEKDPAQAFKDQSEAEAKAAAAAKDDPDGSKAAAKAKADQDKAAKDASAADKAAAKK